MSKLGKVLGTLTISASLVVMSGAVAVAEPGGGAIVVGDLGCTYLDGNGVLVSADPPDVSAHAVYQQKSKAQRWTCKAEGVATTAGRPSTTTLTTFLTCWNQTSRCSVSSAATRPSTGTRRSAPAGT